LLPVDDVATWPVADEISWRSGSIRELAALLEQRTKCVRQSTAVVAQRDATIGELQAQRDATIGELAQRDATIGELQAQTRRSDTVQTEVRELQNAFDVQAAHEQSHRSRNEALQQEVAQLEIRLKTEQECNAQLMARQQEQRKELQSRLVDRQHAMVAQIEKSVQEAAEGMRRRAIANTAEKA